MSGHQARNGVSGTWAGGHKDGGRSAGGSCIPIGHVNCSLFVTDQNKFHFGLNRFEGVEDRNGRSSRVSKDEFNAEIIEGFDQGLGTIKLLLAHDVC